MKRGRKAIANGAVLIMLKRHSNEGMKGNLSDLQKEIDEVEQNAENILEQDKMKRSEWNKFRAEIKRERQEQKTETDSGDNQSELKKKTLRTLSVLMKMILMIFRMTLMLQLMWKRQ